MKLDAYARLATKRQESLFAPDVERRKEELREKIEGRSFMVIGGAGTIGSATLEEILAFRPARVHVVDVNENGLAALIRNLRTGGVDLKGIDLHLEPLDFGSPVLERLIDTHAPFDGVLNFAALKHVRSEKDAYALLQMIDTNIVKQARLLKRLQGRAGSVFVVSTDKAANPVNLMGASKRFMEEVTLGEGGSGFRTSSARFANVAFSNGSLLASWIERFGRTEPLPVPEQTRRYFVSPKESGQICLLAAFLLDSGAIGIPRTGQEIELELLETVADSFVRSHGLEPRFTRDEADALSSAAADKAAGKYPVLLTPLDTTGEKPYEEFVGEGESASECGIAEMQALARTPLPEPEFSEALAWFEEAVSSPSVPASLEEIAGRFMKAVPTFHHAASSKHLDLRI